MKGEDYKPRQYHEVNSFFRNSWGQVPDKTSPSRFMRPRTVVKQHEEQHERPKLQVFLRVNKLESK